MTDETSATAAPPPSRKRRRVAWLVLALAVLAALGFGGWQLWRQLENTTATLEAEDQLIRRLSLQLRQLEAQSDTLARHQDDASSADRKTAEGLLQLQTQQQGALKSIESLDATLKGGRVRFQLAAAEELLLLAHDRAALGGEPAVVINALELADARLAGLSDARVLAVRQALATERLTLMSVPKADITGAALALGSLIAKVEELPLKTRVPASDEPDVRATEEAPLPSNAEWPTRLWHGVGTALKAVFQIRREAKPIDRLLAPEQQALVTTLLHVKLEAARLALLRSETAAWRDSVDSALHWLDAHYQSEDPRVLAGKAELERLRGLELKPLLPVPQKALEQLRTLLAQP